MWTEETTAASPPNGGSGSSPATALQQAIWAWKGHCVAGASALGVRDLDALQRALDGREALQPRIAELVRSLQNARGLTGADFSAVLRLHKEACAADDRLVSLLAAERSGLKREIDNPGAGSSRAAAYGRADAPSPHRLDIVR